MTPVPVVGTPSPPAPSRERERVADRPGEGSHCHTVMERSIVKRVWQHNSDLADGFTKEYQVHTLVWYEAHEKMESAIVREKNIKAWKRLWKLALIERLNPEWNDLYDRIVYRAGSQPPLGRRAFGVLATSQ